MKSESNNLNSNFISTLSAKLATFLSIWRKWTNKGENKWLVQHIAKPPLIAPAFLPLSIWIFCPPVLNGITTQISLTKAHTPNKSLAPVLMKTNEKSESHHETSEKHWHIPQMDLALINALENFLIMSKLVKQHCDPHTWHRGKHATREHTLGHMLAWWWSFWTCGNSWPLGLPTPQLRETSLSA